VKAMLNRGMIAAVCLTMGIFAPGSAEAQDREPTDLAPEVDAIEFQEVQGVREFSGQMTARPLQMEDLRAAGLSRQQAAARRDEAQAALAEYERKNYVPQTDEYIFYVPEGRTETDIARDLMATGLFEYVVPDWRVYTTRVPNDPRFDRQWHHDTNRMNSIEGWDIATGEPTTGVGLCDTGVAVNHPDLQEHRLEGYNAVDQIWESDGGDILDLNGHGTNVIGCAAANGDNDVGVTGVGWNLSFRMLKVTVGGGGSSNISILTNAARTSIESGDRVANVSFSGVDDPSVATTAEYIKSVGGLLFWSAGNEGALLRFGNRDDDDILVVGATDPDDQLAGFSNWGPAVDFTAPGQQVYTTAKSGGEQWADGTSFSSPLAAGLAALIWSINPNLTPDEVEARMKDGADDLGDPGVDMLFGYGRINVANSVQDIEPFVEFDYPFGKPALINPAGGTNLVVEINPVSEVPQKSTGRLRYFHFDGRERIEEIVPLEFIGNNRFRGTFGEVPCGRDIFYSVSFVTDTGRTVRDPGHPLQGFEAFGAVGATTVFHDNFEEDLGWTVENINLNDGAWERAVPSGDGHRGDPPSDSDGSGQAFLTFNESEDSDVDGGPTIATSPTFDLEGEIAIVSYDRWYFNNNADPADRLTVEMSNDGGQNWVEVDKAMSSGEVWKPVSFMVNDSLTTTAEMRIRFSVQDNPNNSITEAAFDNFRLKTVDCQSDPSPCLDLEVTNLVGGERATFEVSNGTPGARTVTVYGFKPGETPAIDVMGFCTIFGIDGINRDRVISPNRARFDADGRLVFKQRIPVKASGRTIFFQAAEAACPDDCSSEVLEVVVE